jgi:hypothetical protein
MHGHPCQELHGIDDFLIVSLVDLVEHLLSLWQAVKSLQADGRSNHVSSQSLETLVIRGVDGVSTTGAARYAPR